MKEAFTSKLGMSKPNEARLATINSILEEYRKQRYILTLRQLYYQLVSRDIIANNQKEYAKLSTLLTKGRMAGIVDWEAIEDRGRQPRRPWFTYGISDALETIKDQYRLNRQDGQPYYIEVWIEKDALSNIFYRVTSEYHIELMVNKGYSSTSAMYEAAQRFKRRKGKHGSKLIYFGDHDASGKDMVRDIRDRMREFRVPDIEVLNPALTMEQIEQYEPPENPAKITDPRAKWYIEEYGENSWELDALAPQVLQSILKDTLADYIDEEKYNAVMELETEHMNELGDLIDKYRGENDNEEDEE